ncbi:MAG: TMEM198/TM7SF3 family protein [Clostridiaceae bacterium]|nr:TMEM198/TM7SF3 family protein [Clostridiaceae bacterium]
MLTFTLIISLSIGIVLCFMGYRFFRVAMALGGFAIGAAIGYFLYPFAAEYLPDAGHGIWLLAFMGIAGILVAFLSFAVYKAALFYISALFTAFLIVKTFLMSFAGGVGVAAFIKTAIGKTAIMGSANAITDYEVADRGTVGELIQKGLEMLPGDTPLAKTGTVLLAAVIVGAIVGIIVCVLQKPAIIVMTSVIGAMLASEGICSLLDSLENIDMTAESVIANFSVGGENLVLSMLVTILLVVAGMVVQFKTTKNMS